MKIDFQFIFISNLLYNKHYMFAIIEINIDNISSHTYYQMRLNI